MEDIEKQSAQTTDAEVDKTLDTGASEIADTSNEVEFTDSNEDSGKDAQGDKGAENQEASKSNESVDNKPQKTNADYARERRKQEQEAAIKKARNEAIIEALNGVNPYTQEKMEDDADIQEYLTMKEIEKNGGDPIADYSKHLKAKAKEQVRVSESEKSQKEWVQKDKADFATKHPDVKLEELLNDELFYTFAVGKVGKMSMDKIYTDYQSFVAKSEERARDRAAQLLANNAATPGKLTNQPPAPPKSIQDMSKAEFESVVERVKRGEKIQL